MFKRVLTLVILGSLPFLSSTWAFENDVDAIRSQAGCFQVQFLFNEPIKTSDGSLQVRPYKSTVTEWVHITENTQVGNETKKISIVHIMTAARGFHVMKHWRETWTYSPTEIWEYRPEQKLYTWEKRSLNPEEYQGRWIQTMHHINDGPNRACEGTWTHGETSKWTCTAVAPITRRDWGRTDIGHYRYNYENTYQNNQFFIGGTIHKFLGQDEVSTEEGGSNYTRVDDSLCSPAQEWWASNQSSWDSLLKAWERISQESSSISLKDSTLSNWSSNWSKLYRAATPNDFYLPWLATRDWDSWKSPKAWSSWAYDWVSPSAWSSWTQEKIWGAPKVDWEKLILEDWDIR